MDKKNFYKESLNLIKFCKTIEGFAKSKELNHFESKVKDLVNYEGTKRMNQECKLTECFIKFYATYKDHIFKKNFSFLKSSASRLNATEYNRCYIPISNIYIDVLSNKNNNIIEIEKYLLATIISCVDDEKLIQIYKEYELIKIDGPSNNDVKTDVNNLTSSIRSFCESSDGNTDISHVITKMLKDDKLLGNVTGFVKTISDGDPLSSIGKISELLNTSIQPTSEKK
jgi:hypothetical protein